MDMLKQVSILTVALLMSSSAFAVDVQVQGTNAQGLNGAAISGDGSAANINALLLNNSQLSTNNVTHDTAYQNTAGSLIQSAGAVGLGGLFNVGQAGDITGAQTQIPSLGVHLQDLNADLYQDVFKVGGEGMALGLQTFVGVQTQLSFNPWGGSANIQGIGTTLYNATGGGPDSGLSIGGGMTVGAGQTALQ
jgi:hypothetical protein